MKTIVQGYIQFANARSFETAVNAFQNRSLVYYKNEFLFKTPDFFDEGAFRFIVPRTVTELSEKHWRNTADAIQFLSQFAIYGKVEAYQLDNGQIVRKTIVEPVNDKQITQDYQEAVKIIQNAAQSLKEAKSLLETVLQAEPLHQQAGEYLAWILLKEKDEEGAIELLNKIIQPGILAARSHYLRGMAYLRQAEPEKALADFDQAIKCSLAIQDLHWKARMQKAKALIELGIGDNAEKELLLYLGRAFDKGSENELAKKAAYFYLGQIQYMRLDYAKSLDYIEKAIAYSGDDQMLSNAKCYYYRGLVRQKLGADSFAEDFELAKSMGFELSPS
jgi:tetratricopeptide (TPR) repeat protein